MMRAVSFREREGPKARKVYMNVWMCGWVDASVRGRETRLLRKTIEGSRD